MESLWDLARLEENLLSHVEISSHKCAALIRENDFSEPLQGKYVVLQRTVEYNNTPINWMEVIVNYEPISLNPEEKVMAAFSNVVIF